MRRSLFIAYALIVALSDSLSAQQNVRKLAFLAGVEKYDKAGLRNLDYAERDVQVLAKELTKAGFTVEPPLLGSSTGAKRATLANLRLQLETVFINKLETLNKQDVALVVLSGHGQQLSVPKNGRLVEDVFYCPVDALNTDPTTLVSIGDLMDLVSGNSGAEQNLFVIDACRDNPGKGSKGIDGSQVTRLPANLAVLFGASAGTQSYESKELEHGLLTYYLLDGLRGKARDDENEVTWGTLVDYVKKRVSRNAPRLVGKPQSPNDISNLTGLPPVLVKIDAPRPIPPTTLPSPRPNTPPGSQAETQAGQQREDNALKLRLVWCPAGSFTMGSPTTDADRIYNEGPVAVTLSQGFWLGRYEVTQGQWQQIMKTEPWMRSASDDSAASFVSWEDSQEFCRKLTESEQKAGRLPPAGEYTLPTEAQWEYACRAGNPGRFSFGDNVSDLGEFAWYEMNAYFDDEEYVHRVGMKRANAWGLHDMHGNVKEWCRDEYAERLPGGRDPVVGTIASSARRVNRGGGWYFPASYCRSAARFSDERSSRNVYVGFRVALNFVP